MLHTYENCVWCINIANFNRNFCILSNYVHHEIYCSQSDIGKSIAVYQWMNCQIKYGAFTKKNSIHPLRNKIIKFAMKQMNYEKPIIWSEVTEFQKHIC